MNDAVERHCREVNRCNQRGGRMLSVPDLLEAGTLDLKLAAFLMARISKGASFLVGASPGGAGKTTVMCALLNFLPPDREIVAATPEAVRAAPGASTACYVCHEVGDGPYFGYLWGEDLRAYCGLPEHGHMLATNLHADTLEEAQEQICGRNGVPLEHFRRFDLLLFLSVSGGYLRPQRRIHSVYAVNGRGEHIKVYGSGGGVSPFLPVDGAEMGRCRAFLEALLATRARSIEEVRLRVVEFLRK